MPQSASPALVFQKGTISMSVLQVSATAMFDTPIDVAYDLYFQTPAGLSLNISGITLSRTGFTINLGVALGAASLRWYAVQQQ